MSANDNAMDRLASIIHAACKRAATQLELTGEGAWSEQYDLMVEAEAITDAALAVSTYEQRAMVIARLEAGVRESKLRVKAQRDKYDALNNAISEAVRVYVEGITAPMRAMADELREHRGGGV